MALPVIQFDSSAGSDSAASGAGPATALTGTAASTSGDGLTVTLDGSPDLTNVAVDGSHVIYLADSTAGNRNFGKITAKDNTAKTVTVSDAFGVSLSGLSWAIGGKRQTLFGTASYKLFENNAANGDAMPGWTMRMLSGFTETRASSVTIRRAGTTADYISLEGERGAATKPILTFSNNGAAFTSSSIAGHVGWRFADFTMKNTNATKTASIAFNWGRTGGICSRLTIADATDKFFRAVATPNVGTSGDPFVVSECEIGHCAGTGLQNESAAGMHIIGCYVHDCGGHGALSNRPGNSLAFSVFAHNTSDGANFNTTDAVIGCVFHSNGGDGLEITTVTRAFNNIFDRNGAYGLNLVTRGISTVDYNAFYNNTSGPRTGVAAAGENDVTLTAEPYTDHDNHDFSLNSTAGGGAACSDAGFPQSLPGGA